MCGFITVVSHGPAISVEDIRRMTDSIAHRGPDGAGAKLFRYGDKSVGLGHRRLSIIDLAGGADAAAAPHVAQPAQPVAQQHGATGPQGADDPGGGSGQDTSLGPGPQRARQPA